ncbi:MAG: FAD-dependent oxidoreductase [Thermodesulfobacteriota bacterium]
MITISINDKIIEAPEGATILEAAARAGVALPTMCYSTALPEGEACRLCQVEVEGFDRPLAACAARVADGMKVQTDTARLQEARRIILRLLLEDHYGDCLAPCSQRCPTNIDIQGYIALIARGQYVDACRLIRQTNPLPLTCGRVCPHPCESNCRRGRVEEPVNINHLKRFVSDIAYQDIDRLNPRRAELTGQKAAIIGGGPAGLTAAFYLAGRGHSPVIYEAMPKLGGMLRYGIPEYRLPKKILDREIEAILRMGVEAHVNQVWGRDFTLDKLLDEGFKAVFLGFGAWLNTRMAIENEDIPGVWPGTIFLNKVGLGQKIDLGRHVAVIGGGNTAMDCARTSLRLGAESVTVFYRRSRKEMPAQAIEVDEAEHEGVIFKFLTAPTKLLGTDKLEGMEYVKMGLGAPDASGRARPEPIAGSEETVNLDSVIVAIGQYPDAGLMTKDQVTAGLKVTRRGTVEADPETGQTSDARVFAAGDLVTGPATVVEAVGSGRRAAEAMDRYLRGFPVKPAQRFIFSKGQLKEVDQANFEDRPRLERVKMPELPVVERQHNFREVETGLSEEQARAEAQRCLSCGCLSRDDCRIRQVGEQIGMRETMVNLKPLQPYLLVANHPHIVIDDNKCVVCRTCERACSEYHGRKAITVTIDRVSDLTAYRGHQTRINADCDHCGLCAANCPTGALSFKSAWTKPGPLPLVKADSVCNLCSLNCQVRVGLMGEHTAQVFGRDKAPNFGHLCRRGRFELAAWKDDPKRLAKPLVRKKGRLVEASWDEAFKALAAGFGKLKKDGAVAGLSFGRGSLEELYLFAKLIKQGLGSNNLDYMDPAAAEPTGSQVLAGLNGGPDAPSYPRLEECQAAILIGPGLAEGLRLIEPALHRLKAKGGRVILAAESDQALIGRADLVLQGSPAEAYAQAADALEGKNADGELGRIAAGGGVCVLISEAGITADGQANLKRLFDAAAAKQAARGVVTVVPNGRAARAAGLTPGEGGLFAGQILAGLESGVIKGLFVHAGLNPETDRVSDRLLKAVDKIEFLAVMASHLEPLAEKAAVVLPRLFCIESEGTFVAGDGTKLEVAAAAPLRPGLKPDWQVLGLALASLGGPAAPQSLGDVRREMAPAEPAA